MTPLVDDTRHGCAGGREHASRPNNRVLVVDDDASVREMLPRVLIGEGYRACAAADGAEALDIVEGRRVDLVLLDLNMPREDGWRTLLKLKAAAPSLPVIIITARSNQLFTALAAGAGALLEKPFDFPHLLQTVSALLEEPAESRLARSAGKPSAFHYLPARQHGQPT